MTETVLLDLESVVLLRKFYLLIFMQIFHSCAHTGSLPVARKFRKIEPTSQIQDIQLLIQQPLYQLVPIRSPQYLQKFVN